MYQYLNAVNSHTAASPSFADGLYVNAVMDAAYHSDLQNKWAEVETIGY